MKAPLRNFHFVLIVALQIVTLLVKRKKKSFTVLLKCIF